MSVKTDIDIERLSPRDRGAWLSQLFRGKRHKHIEGKLPVIKKMISAGAEFSDDDKKCLAHFILQTPARACIAELLAAGIRADTTFEGYSTLERVIMARDAKSLGHVLKKIERTEYNQDMFVDALCTAARNFDENCVYTLAQTFKNDKRNLDRALTACATASTENGSALAPTQRKALYMKRKTMFVLMDFGAEIEKFIHYWDVERDCEESLEKKDFFKLFKLPEVEEIEKKYARLKAEFAASLSNGFAATAPIQQPRHGEIIIATKKTTLKL